jgi:hypothetical protein
MPILAAEAVNSRDPDCDEWKKQKHPKYMLPGPHRCAAGVGAGLESEARLLHSVDDNEAWTTASVDDHEAWTTGRRPGNF